MNSTLILSDLFRQMAWADAATWSAVLAYAPAAGDGQIRERLHHIHLCQHVWLKIWSEDSFDPHAGESLDLADLANWARDYHEEVDVYFASLDESALARKVIVPETGDDFQQPQLWESFVQITTHSTYHRGQVSARLREIGGEPAQTDFIAWVGLGKPMAEWK
ncbi:MAG: hypothetical protein DYH05_11000 [Acidobacteria bacterium ACB1]|nr:hypothetical protein [Acidobacteria bacterium ACB1]RIJ96254.1 MAG: hypothetical protein DCC44_00625 [Acidobacteriota bacterium]